MAEGHMLNFKRRVARWNGGGVLCGECAQTGDTWAPAATLPSLFLTAIHLLWLGASLVWVADERVVGLIGRLEQ